MPELMSLTELSRVLLSILLVVVAAVISRWQRADLEKDLFWAVVRSFIQLIAVGYVLELVFSANHPLATLAILCFMIGVASWTTGTRSKRTPHARPIALVSISTGTFITVLSLVGLGIFEFVPRDIIPIGGMIIGNAMTTCSLVLVRFTDDLRDQQNEVETRLALGATAREASQKQFRRAIRSAMIHIIDTTKTIGLIKLPGAMTGMILAGASPLEAIQLQLIVMYMLVGANAFTGLSAAYLMYREFFTPTQQLQVAHE